MRTWNRSRGGHSITRRHRKLTLGLDSIEGETALARLQSVSGEAVETLRRNLCCGIASVEVRAALGVLDHTLKVQEFFEFENRVPVLEQLVASRERNPPC